MEIEKLIGIGFIIAWFVFWGYILITNPAVFFKFQEQGDQRIRSAARATTKASLFGMKHIRK